MSASKRATAWGAVRGGIVVLCAVAVTTTAVAAEPIDDAPTVDEGMPTESTPVDDAAPTDGAAEPAEDPTPAPDPDRRLDANPGPPVVGSTEEPTEERDEGGWIVLPTAFYTPETELGGGILGAFFFRWPGADGPRDRLSYVGMTANYTMRDQLIIAAIPEIYGPNRDWQILGELEFVRFPDRFYGIGNDMPEEAREDFTPEAMQLYADVRRRIVGQWYGGVLVDLQSSEIVDADANGVLQSEEVPGAPSGFTSGIGGVIALDLRDNPYLARTGSYHLVQATTYRSWIGSDFEWNRLRLDARYFLPLGRDHTLAAQVLSELNDGAVPYFSMAWVGGGANNLRGYYRGRYRDHNLAMTQVEYRSPFWWRLGGVAFAGIGDVFRRFEDIDPSEAKWSLGVGARIALKPDEGINARVDAGFGRHGSFGLYVGVKEAF